MPGRPSSSSTAAAPRCAPADAGPQAAALSEVLDDLGLTGTTVVGHSFGADVALAVGRSDRVARVVVLAQAPDLSDATFPRGNGLMASRLGPVLHALATPPTVRRIARVAYAPGFPVERAEQEQTFRDQRAMHPGMYRVVLRERRDRMRRVPLDAQLAVLGKPSLVILGGRDQFYGARSADRYRAAGAEVHVLAEAGHSLPTEAPAEVARLIRAFVG